MILEICNSSSLANTLDLVKKILLIIEIIIPVIIFLYITIEFIKVTKSSEEKKLINKINKKFILLFIVYLIPIIIFITMYFLGDSSNISSCWNNKKDNTIEEIKKNINDLPPPKIDQEEEEEETENQDSSYVNGDGSTELAYSIAELAVKVAPVANPNSGFKEDAWLSYGEDRDKTDSKMQNYIKIMDATVTTYLNDTSNPNNHIGYNNPAYCSSAGAAGAIIRATVDPDFDTFNNCYQIDYINKHQTKWIKVGVIKAGDIFDEYCKPGDLLIAGEMDESGNCTNFHTMIYVGNELAKKKFANTKGNMFQATYNSSSEGKNSTCPAIDYFVKDIRDYQVYRPTEENNSYYKKIDIEKVLSDKMQTGSFWKK